MIHVCYGTQAELIKLAPIIRELVRRGTDHRIIFTGQHVHETQALLKHFHLRQPDCTLYVGQGVYSAARAAWWAASTLTRAVLDRARFRRDAFGAGPGVCVVHGDTLSTLLVVMLARVLGLSIAHVESGLRSYNWRCPFPEEIVRVIADRRADLLFAPGPWARDNLLKMKVTGRIVTLVANTGKDALDYTLALPGRDPAQPCLQRPFALASIHRFETVTRPDALARAVDVVGRAAENIHILWPLHTVTRRALQKACLLDGLAATNVTPCDILPYPAFAGALAAAEFVIADGGSIQEESFFLDKPCLLLRHTTERREGLGENVVLSRWDAETIDAFLARPGQYRRRTAVADEPVSPVLVDELLAFQQQLDIRSSA